ncbi:MAG: hypothetical protein JST09_19045 [Bacteroidetes bacterium]|nr:hypothetical protein [Bacteroidota bacterium]
MITFKFKASIGLLLIGFVVGLCLSFLFMDYSNEQSLKHEKIVPVKDLKKEVEDKEASYQTKITELENKNEQLQQELKSTKDQLSAIKSRTKQRESNIKKIIDPGGFHERGYPAKELLHRVNPSVITDAGLSPCDTLINEVGAYLEENALKDSLYESQISKQDSLIAGKDSVIEVKTRLHQDLQAIIDKSLVQQETLMNENKQLHKQFKRQKLRSKLFAIGVTVLSGFTANYLIHH